MTDNNDQYHERATAYWLITRALMLGHQVHNEMTSNYPLVESDEFTTLDTMLSRLDAHKHLLKVDSNSGLSDSMKRQTLELVDSFKPVYLRCTRLVAEEKLNKIIYPAWASKEG